MLQFLYRDYRMSHQNRIKKAVIISFSGKVTEADYQDYCKELNNEIEKNHDSYIFLIKKVPDLSAYALKLLYAFSNTSTRKTGLLIKNPGYTMLESFKLEDRFIMSKDIKSILKQLEQSGPS